MEDVVGGRLQSVDDDGRVAGVGRPVVGRVQSVVVQQFVENDLSIAMSFDRRVPVQTHARGTGTGRCEVVRRARWYYNQRHTVSTLYITDQQRCDRGQSQGSKAITQRKPGYVSMRVKHITPTASNYACNFIIQMLFYQSH